jgi:hypothetical protein
LREAISRSPKLRSLWQMRATAASIASRDRALLQRLLHSGRSLFSSKGSRLRSPLTTVGSNSSAVSKVVNRSAALETFAAPADLPPFAGKARVDDLSLRVTAKWTMHGDTHGGGPLRPGRQPYTGNRRHSATTSARTRSTADSSPM